MQSPGKMCDGDTVTKDPSRVASFSAETRFILGITPAYIPSDYQDRVRARVAILRAETLALGTHQNSLHPINQLAPEILSTIFKLFKADITSTWGFPIRLRLSWMAPTRVCRYWRAIALGVASLWTTIDFVKPEIAELMLRRSKDALLDTRPAAVSSLSIPTLRQALFQTHRWRCIHVGATTKDFKALLSTPIRSAPFLEELTLFDHQRGDAKLPQGFLEDGAPFLKKLDFSGFDLGSDWKVLPFSATITDLSLKSPPTGTRPTLQEFLGAMQRMPYLFCLKLDNILPLSDVQTLPTNDLPSSTFAKVAKLKVSDLSNAIDLFTHVSSFPQCTNFRAVLDDETASFGLIAQSPNAFMRFLPENGNRPSQTRARVYLHSLSIRDCGDVPGDSLAYKFTFERDQPGDEPRGTTIDYEPPDFPLCHFLGMLHAQFNMSSLRVLEFISCALPRSIWKAAFVQLENLVTIHFLCDSQFRELFALLDQDPSLPQKKVKIASARSGDISGTPPAPTYLPALTTIKFSHMELEDEDIMLLGKRLKRRSASWFGLTVRIESCKGFVWDDYRTLLNVAPNLRVSWDGHPE